jgi:RES domain
VICGLPVPGASEAFTTLQVNPSDVPVWFHVYSTKTHPNRAETFSQGWGDTRFAPIQREDGTPVHTYYAASTPECAYMESVLHDIPLLPPGAFNVDELQFYHLTQFTLRHSLECASFHTPYLPALQNMTRAQLIDSLPVCYPETRAWAQAAYLQRPKVQAIAYGSRRDDAGRCLMLFKQRSPDPPFYVTKDEPLALAPRRKEVLALIRRLHVREI